MAGVDASEKGDMDQPSHVDDKNDKNDKTCESCVETKSSESKNPSSLEQFILENYEQQKVSMKNCYFSPEGLQLYI